MTGAYGYVDKDGRKHVVKYTAGKDGFKGEPAGRFDQILNRRLDLATGRPQTLNLSLSLSLSQSKSKAM